MVVCGCIKHPTVSMRILKKKAALRFDKVIQVLNVMKLIVDDGWKVNKLDIDIFLLQCFR